MSASGHMERVASLPCEEWRRVPGFGGHYEASSLGRVRVGDRIVLKYNHKARNVIGQQYKARLLNPTLDRGYLKVHIGVGKKKFFVAVHRMVLWAFAGMPGEGQEGCHCNGVSTDNRAENLRWGSHLSNNQDRKAHGRYAAGGAHHLARYTEAQIEQARSAASVKEAVLITGMSRTQAYRVRNGRRSDYVPRG